MALYETIVWDCEKAFKEGRTRECDTLRLLRAALHNREIEKRGKGETNILSDDEVYEILRREVKKRKEAFSLYTQGGREDRAQQEKEESVILERYLPTLMSEEDIVREVKKILACIEKPFEFGKVMREVMKVLKGKADAEAVQRVVREALTGHTS